LSLQIDVLGIGLNATDTLLLVPEFPAYAGKVAFRREMLSPGGQVATAVVTCARLGLRTKYIGTIGDDLRGEIQRESLSGTGVDTSGLIVRENCPNQTAYILIDERTGERTVLWQRADCLRLRPEEIQEFEIANARLLHIDGYDVDAAVVAAATARKHKVPVSIDVDTVYPGFDAVLKHVDYLVAGSNWPAKWTGETDPFVALSRLQKEYSFKVASMTLGEHGSLALSNDRWFYSPAFQITCADTTGAGDAFHGAFCCAMVEGISLDAALEFSNAAAALNCTAIGARGHIPVRSEIHDLIARSRAGQVKRHTLPEVAERCRRQPADGMGARI
jgi:sulfofructose kinase